MQFVPPVERDLISNVRSAIEPVEKLKNWVTWCLRETRPFEGGRPVVDWKRQFVLRLAAFWRVMTDSQPGTSDNSPFGRFVSAAWSSLYHDSPENHDSPETSWDDCIGSYSRSESAEEAIVSVSLAALYVGFVWAGGFPENPRDLEGVSASQADDG